MTSVIPFIETGSDTRLHEVPVSEPVPATVPPPPPAGPEDPSSPTIPVREPPSQQPPLRTIG